MDDDINEAEGAVKQKTKRDKNGCMLSFVTVFLHSFRGNACSMNTHELVQTKCAHVAILTDGEQ